MGEHGVEREADEAQQRAFMKALLEDVLALERLIAGGKIETGIRRIGAEQEMFLVDRNHRPAPIAPEVLARVADPRLTTELARFNLEANLSPQVFGGDCLRKMETELCELWDLARKAAGELGGDAILTGILPTLRKSDLGLQNLSPVARYHELNDTLRRLRGGDFHVHIRGVDELDITHDNVLLEACNTSFQVHFQVGPEEFSHLYNIAQAITGPVLAASVNSPLLLDHRLWHETRVALFERSVDTRISSSKERRQKSRVHFGDAWVTEGVLEIFREDIARFRVLLITSLEDSRPLSIVEGGGVPDLRALRLHNGTIYRWNRACYGISDGVPHLRIENRVLPAGPSTLDEMAGAALFFGLMASFSNDVPRMDQVMSFDDAKTSFFAAARYGLKAQLTWIGGRSVSAQALLRDELLPRARDGLTSAGLDVSDIDRYLGTIEERVNKGVTGAQWILSSLASMGAEATADARNRALTSAIIDHQTTGEPVHTWPLAALRTGAADLRDSYRTVGQFMSTDLFTVRPNDIVDFAASVMEWRHIRHVPVEDEAGMLVGIVSHRALLRLIARGKTDSQTTVGSIMHPNPTVVPPETGTLEAMQLMRAGRVGCLPVVVEGRLVGLVTERDLMDVSARLLEDYLRDT